MPTIILIFRKLERYPAVFLALLAAVQLACLPGRYLGFEHDDVMYVLASRSLLTGHYGLGISPGLPPLTDMTPGWPILLLPAALLSGDSPLGYQLWSWVWLVLCTVLFWVWIRRRFAASLAFAATALFALNPLVLSRSGVVMSEVPFLAILLGLLLSLESPKGLAGWKSGLALGFAWLVRPGALPLLPAVWLAYMFQKKRRDALLSIVVSSGIILLWKLWVASSGRELAEVQELAMSYQGSVPRDISHITFFNAGRVLDLIGRTLLPWRPAVGSVAAMAVGTLYALLAAAGLMNIMVRRRYETAGIYLVGGVLMHAFWPWWYERYLLSFLPFLIWCVAVVVHSAERRQAPTILAALAFLPLAGQLPLLADSDAQGKRPGLERTHAWIRGNTPGHALFAGSFYARDAFYTGRPFVPMPVSVMEDRSGRTLADRLRERRISYVLWEDLPDLGSSLGPRFFWNIRLGEFREIFEGGGLRPVFANTSESSIVFAVPADGHQSHTNPH